MGVENSLPHDAVSALLDRLGRAGDPSVAVVEEYIGATTDPVLARALPRAAIPRRLDARALAAVAEVSDVPGEGDRLLAEIIGLPFTHRHPGGGWRYHDRTRDALLLDWRSAEHRAEFQRISELLSADYESRFQEASELMREVEIASAVLSGANPQRYSLIRFTVLDQLLVTFKEAAYHSRNCDPGALSRLLDRRCDQIEASDRLTDIAIGQLHRVIGPAGDAADLPPLELANLTYWELRLTFNQDPDAVQDPVRRLEQLCADLDKLADDPQATRLRVWTLIQLADYLISQDQLRSAADACERVLALSSGAGGDAWNLPAVYWRLAALRRRMGEPESAREALREAGRLSQAVGNHRVQILALLEEADLLLQHGDGPGARRAGADALDAVWCLPGQLIARGEESTEFLDVYQWLAIGYVPLVTADNVRLSDTAISHALALVPKTAAEYNRFVMQLNQALELTRHGALSHAGRILGDLRTRIETIEGKPQRAQLSETHSVYQAYLEHALGNHEKAIDLWEKFIDQRPPIQDRPSLIMAMAWSNLAEDLVEVRRWEQAWTAAGRGRTAWTAMGDDPNALGMQALQARILIGQGRLDQGVQLLEQTRDRLASDPSERADYYHQAAIVVAATEDNWIEAARIQQQRAGNAFLRGNEIAAARALAASTRAYSRASAWSQCAAAATSTADSFSRLAAAESFEASARQRSADGKLAAAVQLFFDGSGDRSDDLADARSYLGDAIIDDPDNSWLLVAMFYVRRDQGAWREAQHALGELRRQTPGWLAVEWLDAREAELETQRSTGASRAPVSPPAEPETNGPLQRLAGWLSRLASE